MVRPKAMALYSVEIWRSGVREAVVPIMKNEITIGRGSRSISVDLPIKGDPEVSRVHAVLSRDNEGRYWLVAKGRNPTLVNGKELIARRTDRSRARSEDRDLQLRYPNPAESRI